VLWRSLPEASRREFLVPPPPAADDSHPPHAERCAAVAQIVATEPDDPRLWEAAIPNVAAWEVELEGKFLVELDRRLDAAHELPRDFTKPPNEESFAAALGAHADACRAFNAAPLSTSLPALTQSEQAIGEAAGLGSRLHLAVVQRLVIAQLKAGALEEAAKTADRLLGLLPNDEMHALDRSQVEQLKQTALSNLPPAIRAGATPDAAAGARLLKCAGCGSASRESEFQQGNKCPWCGAAWTPPTDVSV
jgi:hypothetical protein